MHDKNINQQVKRTAKDSFYYLPTAIVSAVVGVLLIRVLTTLFSPEEYGHYQITLATFGLINLFSVTWLSSSVMRFYQNSVKQHNESTFLSTVFWGAGCGALIVAALSFAVIYSIRSRFAPELFPLMNIAILASGISSFFEIFIVVFRAGLRPKKYALYYIFFSVGKPLIGVLLILLFNFRVDGVFWAFVFVPAFLLFFISHEFSLPHVLKSAPPSINLLSQLFRYGSQISLTILAFWILSFSDRYLIEYFVSTDQVGFYSVGHSISEKTLNFLYVVLMLAAYPVIINNWENHGKESTQQLITELAKYYFILFTPVLIMLIVMPKNILLLFASDKFIAGAKVIPLIAVAFFINGISQYALKGFELNQKTRHIATMALTVSILNISLNLFLIPRIGIIGAALSSCLSYTVYFILAVAGTHSDMAFRMPWRTIRIVGFASLCFAGILLSGTCIPLNFFVSIFVLVPVGLALYFIILYLLGEINSSVLNMISRMVKRAFAR